MCGIVGAIAQRDVAGNLLEGLRRLEYRGYDRRSGRGGCRRSYMTRLRRLAGKVHIVRDAAQQRKNIPAWRHRYCSHSLGDAR